MPSQYTDSRIDMIADAPPLSAYVLAPVGATPGTLTGFFVGLAGSQQTALQTFQITAPITLTNLFNTAVALPLGLPLTASAAGLLGFVGTLSGGPVVFSLSGNPDGTIAVGQVPIAGYPQLPSGPAFALGRVSPALGSVLASVAGGASVTVTPSPVSVQRVNAGFSAPGQTIKNYTGAMPTSAGAATVVPLETVTAGKIYVITDIFISANSANQFEARIQANGTDIFRGWCKGDTSPINLGGIESQPNASAGQSVTLLLPAIAGGPSVSFFIGGFEQ